MSAIDTFTSFDLYSHEANQYALLSSEEERELARRYQRGDEAAGHRLICCNLCLAISVVSQYSTNARIEKLDLIQQANIGLMRAAKKYDPESGWRFSTYAVSSIISTVVRYCDEKGHAVHLPQHVLIAHRKELRGERLTKDTRPLEAARPWLQGECISLDASIEGHEDEITYADVVDDPHAQEPFERMLNWMEVEPLLAQLPARQREVLELLYGFRETEMRHTYTSIGWRYGISKTRVQGIEQQALNLLRQLVREQGAEPEAHISWVNKDDPNYVSISEAARLADCCQATCMQIIKSLALPLRRVEGRKRLVLARADVTRVKAAVCRESQQRARGRAAS